MTANLFRKTLLASSIALTMGTTSVEAALVTDVWGANTWSTDSANFTMLWGGDNVYVGGEGGVVGGTNDVNVYWDGNGFNANSDYTGPGSVSNVTASSTTPFYGNTWTAHDIQMFAPGTYSFDVTQGGGSGESGILAATVNAGQLGMHMLFDWSGSLNIDVFMVFSPSTIFGSGLLLSTETALTGKQKCDASFTGTITQNCLYDGGGYGPAGQPVKDQIWMLASIDPDGDGVMGVPMAAGGPAAGFNFNFNANLIAVSTLSAVPLPNAVWLFGSGLMGLLAAVRRKKAV